MTKEINLQEHGTLAVMEWIAANKPEHLGAQIFSHNGEPFLVVSDQDEEGVRWILSDCPLEKWFEINGAKRCLVQTEDCEPHWYFYINGKYYFASLY